MLYCVQVLDEIGRSLNFSYGAAVLDLVREGRVTMGAALAGLSFSSALAARPRGPPPLPPPPGVPRRPPHRTPQPGGVAWHRAGHRGRCRQDGTVHV